MEKHTEKPTRKFARVRDAERLSRGLGLFSIGLGLAEVAAPRALSRAIGVTPWGNTVTTVRAMGAREIIQGVTILARPNRAAPLWMRVAGDVVDVALLVYAFRAKRRNATRLGIAIAAVLGVAAIDAYASRCMQKAH